MIPSTDESFWKTLNYRPRTLRREAQHDQCFPYRPRPRRHRIQPNILPYDSLLVRDWSSSQPLVAISATAFPVVDGPKVENLGPFASHAHCTEDKPIKEIQGKQEFIDQPQSTFDISELRPTERAFAQVQRDTAESRWNRCVLHLEPSDSIEIRKPATVSVMPNYCDSSLATPLIFEPTKVITTTKSIDQDIQSLSRKLEDLDITGWFRRCREGHLVHPSAEVHLDHRRQRDVSVNIECLQTIKTVSPEGRLRIYQTLRPVDVLREYEVGNVGNLSNNASHHLIPAPDDSTVRNNSIDQPNSPSTEISSAQPPKMTTELQLCNGKCKWLDAQTRPSFPLCCDLLPLSGITPDHPWRTPAQGLSDNSDPEAGWRQIACTFLCTLFGVNESPNKDEATERPADLALPSESRGPASGNTSREMSELVSLKKSQ